MTIALQIVVSIACFVLGELLSTVWDRYRSARQVVQQRANDLGFTSSADTQARCPYREGTPEHTAWHVGRCAGLTARLRGWVPPGGRELRPTIYRQGEAA